MSELKRIDPRAVPEMFMRYNVRPTRGEWYRNRDELGERCRGGCLVAILVIREAGEARMELLRHLIKDGELDDIGETIGYDVDYLEGLVAGWDGDVCPVLPDARWVGWGDGMDAWMECRALN